MLTGQAQPLLPGPAARRRTLAAELTSADNALADSLNATVKRKTRQGAAAWADGATCRRNAIRWATRCHSSWVHLSPNASASALVRRDKSRLTRPPLHPGELIDRPGRVASARAPAQRTSDRQATWA